MPVGRYLLRISTFGCGRRQSHFSVQFKRISRQQANRPTKRISCNQLDPNNKRPKGSVRENPDQLLCSRGRRDLILINQSRTKNRLPTATLRKEQQKGQKLFDLDIHELNPFLASSSSFTARITTGRTSYHTSFQHPKTSRPVIASCRFSFLELCLSNVWIGKIHTSLPSTSHELFD